MNRLLIGIVGIGTLLCGAGRISAQEATEFYIPVGRSPGVSGVSSAIGTCRTTDVRERTVTVAGPSTSWTATITNRTKIWLDRSKLGLPNQVGTLADVQEGRRIEVKYAGDDKEPGAPCEWIKVEVTSGN